MKNKRHAITAIMLAGTLGLSLINPISTFAKNKDGHENGNNKVKVENTVKADKKLNKDIIAFDKKINNAKNITAEHRAAWKDWFSKWQTWFKDHHEDSDNHPTNSTTTTSVGPVINGLTAPNTLTVGQIGTWKLKISGSNNTSLTYNVDWGDNAYSPNNSKQNQYSQTAEFTHAYAKAGTYTVNFQVTNSSGQTTNSSVTVNVIDAAAAPVISNLGTANVNARHASIRWNTDIQATSMIWFGTTTPVSTSGNANMSHLGLVKNHNLELNNLVPNTTYYLVVGSANPSGSTTKSSEISFTTKALENDNTPVIVSIAGTTTVETGSNNTWTINAYDPKNSSLSYSVDWGDSGILAKTLSLFTNKVFVQTASFDHVYANPGTYTAVFTVENSNGNKTSYSLQIIATSTSDTSAPLISTVVATNIGSTTEAFSWVTNEPSTTKVFASTSTPVDMNASSTLMASNDTLVTSHLINLTGLNATTTYYFVVQSKDSSNNTSTSAQGSFTTGN